MSETKTPKNNTAKSGSSDDGNGSGRRRRAKGEKPFDENDPALDKREIMSLVCKLFIEGKKVSEIAELLEEEYPDAGYVSREKPYYIISEAAVRGWLRYHAPAHLALGEEIRQRYPWLERVAVAHTTVPTDVAKTAALMLRGLVQERHRENRDKNEVHIGFAAGFSMQQLAHEFAELLCEPADDLPETITFHALVAGYDPGNPTTDPNAFFLYFNNHPVLHITPRFVSLHAPTMVRTRALTELQEYLEIDYAYKGVRDLDIIATSGADWEDDHSSLRKCMERSPESLSKLEGEGAIIDLCWRPMGANGPIEIEEDDDVRAMTLIQLSSLPELIREGKKVLMTLGPCCICNRPKGRVLSTVLNLPENFVTHVVCDSRSARYLLGES